MKKFIEACDRSGLPIPYDSLVLRKEFESDYVNKLYLPPAPLPLWPPVILLPFMSLAQHHGVPTRLLDFSYNPFVAAYFSSSCAIKRIITNYDHEEKKKLVENNLTVWIIDAGKLPHNKVYEDEPMNLYEIGFYKSPGSTTSNLAAQRGCFLYLRSQSRQNINIDRFIKFDSAFDDKDDTELYKIELPIKLAAALYERCIKYGFSRDVLFPGYDGSAQCVIEEFLIERFKKIIN